MGRMETLSKLSRQNIEEVTGGNDFLYFEIVVIPIDGNGMSLTAYVKGTHTIRQVNYEMIEGRPPYLPTDKSLNDFMAGRHPNIQLGDIPGVDPNFETTS